MIRGMLVMVSLTPIALAGGLAVNFIESLFGIRSIFVFPPTLLLFMLAVAYRFMRLEPCDHARHSH